MTEIKPQVFEQIRSAYRLMSDRARYRPAALSDGLGNITVPIEDLNFENEARVYAERWRSEEDKCQFFIGNGDFQTRKAQIFTIEAARNLSAG